MNEALRMVRVGAALLVAAVIGGQPGGVRAETPAAAPGSGSGAACAFEGLATLPPDLFIEDLPAGGKVIGRFTGGPTALRVSAFPPAGALGRARVATGTGTGSFRLVGYAQADRIPLFATQPLPVVPGHLWIGDQREVRVVGSRGDRLEVELRLTEPFRQDFRTETSCATLSLAAGTPAGWDVPGDARGYVVAADQIELYDQPGRDRALVTVLSFANGTLLWSREAQDGFVHVEYHGGIVIDAWAKERHLRALPPGETRDAAAPPRRQPGTPQLRMDDIPREIVTRKEVSLRSGAAESAPVIGAIEPNTRTYVLDVVAGWASVLPRSLHVAPPDQGQFWASATELGLRKPAARR
ncbi:MAG TPA: hypothetical protein PLU22_07825 [Polyangiaceae bacterium]|nr:hypothetical protein [Polyangiaceae bacterium]